MYSACSHGFCIGFCTPFGMGMKGLEKENDLAYQFNGMIEREKAFGLELYETANRGYDPQIGRFWQVEPLADLFVGISVYQFGYNNPVSYNDPSGLNPCSCEPLDVEGFKLWMWFGLNRGLSAGERTWNAMGGGFSGGSFRSPTADRMVLLSDRNQRAQISDPLSFTNLKNSSSYEGYRAKDIKNDIQSINPNLSEEKRNWASGIAFENIYFDFVSYTPLKKGVFSSYKPDGWIIPIPKMIIPDHIHATSMSYSNGITISYEYGGILEVKASDVVLMQTSRNQIATMITYLTYYTDVSGFYSLKEHKAASFTLVVPYGAYIHHDVLEAATNANINPLLWLVILPSLVFNE